MSEWTQLNVGLGRPAGAASARASASILFGELAGPLAGWREDGFLTCFFFQRKPPDVRLRFCTPVWLRLEAELTALIRPLRERGVVTSYWSSVYEPEHRKFGGPSAMAAVHRWFDADTRIWLELELEADSTHPATDASVLCPTAANDLFARVLGDADEVWDTWCNYRALLPDVESAPSPSRIESLAALASKAPPREAAILTRYDDANQRLADSLAAVSESGELAVGVRAVLPFVVQHSFQRWGLGGRAQVAIVDAMCHAWDPHRRLRGA